jgi:hypothetical protein
VKNNKNKNLALVKNNKSTITSKVYFHNVYNLQNNIVKWKDPRLELVDSKGIN